MGMTTLDYTALTKGLTTKSEKIRTLARAGAPTAEIAKFLGIRYQHARNVLMDAGLHGGAKDEAAGGFQEQWPSDLETKMLPPPAVPVVNQRGHVWIRVNDDGSVTIPADLIQQVDLKPGDPVYVGCENDGLEVLSSLASVKRVQMMFASHAKPGESVVDEFLRERREESRRVDERYDRLAREAAQSAASREREP